jgi:hypothetical protein
MRLTALYILDIARVANDGHMARAGLRAAPPIVVAA